MSQALMKCPNTAKPLYVGLNLEWGELECLDLVAVDQQVSNCPHCGQTHRFEKNDLFLRADGAG